MRDLFVTTHTPVLGSGRAVRTYGVARALATHRELDLLYVRFGADEPDTAFRAIAGVQLHEVVPSRGVQRLLVYASARVTGVPDSFARGISRELAMQASLLANANANADGRVIADGPITAAALAGLARKRPVIYNAHNLESGFRGDLSEVSSGHAQAMRRFERGLLMRATEAWMVSQPDIEGAQALCPAAALRYVPNVVDVPAIMPVGSRQNEPQALFVANFSYEPNRNGLRFLLEEVFPRVWTELPNARLKLVGSGLERSPTDDPRIETAGFVENLADEYGNASCAVVPLLQGGGTPLKFIEALAYELPVIATSRAAAGLEVLDGKHCLIADGGEAFARALTNTLRDGAPELGRAGRELAIERYSIEALSKLLAP